MKKIMLVAVILGFMLGTSYFWYDYSRVYELKFDTNDGNTMTSLSLKHNETIPSLDNPLKEGYVFAGWYTDSARTEPFSMETMPKNPLTLYADWGTEGLHFVKVGTSYTVSIGTATAAHIVIPKRHLGGLVTAIAYQGFQHKSTIESVIIPNTVEVIGEKAFFLNQNLVQIIIEEGSVLVEIRSQAFHSNGITSFTVPASVISIGYEAFFSTTALQSITFESGSQLQSIEARAFMANISLNNLILPDTVETIGNSAFEYCTSLSVFTISPASALISIGNLAFFGMPITTIYLPSQLNQIGNHAFFETFLTALFIPISVETIGSGAISANVPSHVFTSIYVEAETKPVGWSNTWNSYNFNVVWGAGR